MDVNVHPVGNLFGYSVEIRTFLLYICNHPIQHFLCCGVNCSDRGKCGACIRRQDFFLLRMVLARNSCNVAKQHQLRFVTIRLKRYGMEQFSAQFQ